MNAISGNGGNQSGSGIDASNSSIGVAEEEVASRIDRHIGRVLDAGGGGWYSISVELPNAASGNDPQKALPVHTLDAAAAHFTDDQVSGVIEGHPHRVRKPAVECGSSIRDGAIIAVVRAVSRNRGDDSGLCVHTPDPAVHHIGYEQVARGIERQSNRLIKSGIDRGAAVSAPRRGAGTCRRGDVSGLGVHSPDPIAVRLRDKQVAGSVQRQTPGTVERGQRTRAAVSAGRCHSVAGHDCENPGDGVHSDHAVVPAVGDVEIVGAIDGHAEERGKLSVGREPADASGSTAGHGCNQSRVCGQSWHQCNCQYHT